MRLKIIQNLVDNVDIYDEKHNTYTCLKCHYGPIARTSYARHMTTDRHLLSEEEYKQKRSDAGYERQKNGEMIEFYVLELLGTLGFEDLIHTRYSGNKYDICIKYFNNSNYYGIQVKILSSYKDRPGYSIQIKNNDSLDINTLIVGVSLDLKTYAIFFRKDMKKITMIMSKTVNSQYLCNDLNIFKKSLYEKINLSFIINNINDYLSPSAKAEIESFENLSKLCESYNKTLIRNNTNFSQVDAFLDGRRLQFKTSSYQYDKGYNFHLGKRNKGSIFPYQDTDNIDFFIFEISDHNQGNFYIVPTKVLIEIGYIETENQKGRLGICLYGPGCHEKHWIHQFYNKFDQLIEGKTEDIILNDLHKICISKNFKIQVEKNKITSINSHKVLHKVGKKTKKSKNNLVFDLAKSKNKIGYPLHKEDGYKFIIFDFGEEFKDRYLIIPTEILIEHGYISTNDKKGMMSITIPFYHPNIDHFSGSYLNKFDLLELKKPILKLIS